MNILIIGAGGREHAIGEKIRENKKIKKLYFAPGNAGTALIGENIDLLEIDKLCFFAKEQKIDLTIVGSEALLAEGIVDAFHRESLVIFGPHQKAALLEGSKVFAKSFMQKYTIKTPLYKIFSSYEKALNYLDELTNNDFPLVIKASGLAQGKGVFISKDKIDAREVLKKLMVDGVFNKAGEMVVIEEFLEGKEISIVSIFNKKEIIPFISAKDHKKIGEKETGLNTGGMGGIAPNPYMSEEIWEEFYKNILEPTKRGILEEGLAFSGVIFFGLMLTKKGLYLLEYNLRMGDPETQTLLPLMQSDLLEIIQSALYAKPFSIEWKKGHSCSIVLASKGYPSAYEKGKVIKGMEDIKKPYFIAGARLKDKQWISDGGRVLNIIGLGKSAKEAREEAYDKLKYIFFEGMYFRRDIGL